ncbi:MAG: autotransporter outer membrane beta-barrel domain-containing protein, partial [Candidatus Omnitrophica bacterium]|nr:autotransporter outer membrane beta-barrel domain-containing protein [Candidatus Omnitrophota bacterium]
MGNVTANDVNVETNGTLKAGGSGTVTGNLWLSDSAGGPGATLDLQTYVVSIVGGTFDQTTAGTTLKTTSSGATIGLLDATGAGGAVAISGAGNLNITVASTPNAGTYTVVLGDVGGGNVDASGFTVTSSSPMWQFSVVGAGVDDLQILASRVGGAYNAAATNGNATAVGTVLDEIAGAGATGDMATVLGELDLASSDQVGNAMDTMSPDVSSGAAEASRAITAQGFTMISNRLGGARSGGFVGSGVSSGEMMNGVGVWLQGLGSHMKQDERKGIEGYKANIFGTSLGADKLIDKHFRAGLAGSYGWARVKSKTPGSPSDDINSYQATVYGSYDSLDLCEARKLGKNSREAVRNQGDDFWYVDGMAAFTQNNYDSRREIWLPGSKRVAKADHYGQQYSTNFETGYTFTFEETKKLEVTPFASLGYNFLYMNKYKERGANALNLTVDGEGFHQLEQALGTKLAYPMVAEKMGTFIPSVKAAWLYDYIGDRFETTASFAGGGPSFNTRGAKPAKNGMLFGAELAFLNKGNMTLTGNWDMELKDQFMSNTYYGTARYDF